MFSHLDSAFNLARWLLRDRAEAEAAVQAALFRAYQSFGSSNGGQSNIWLLKIIHHVCYSSLEKKHPSDLITEFDQELEQNPAPNSKILEDRSDRQQHLTAALESLPVRCREVLALRELEGCSYEEIAEITEIPLEMVMPTLDRAREQLLQVLTVHATKETSSGS
jgi:RNA polymerase sigma factor (sigma-70 family)